MKDFVQNAVHYLPYILGGTIGSTLVGLFAYRMRAKIDVWRMTKQADVAAAQTPMSVLQQAIAQRDKMLETLTTQLYAYISEHEKKDGADRDKLIQVLTKIEAAMTDLARDQRDLREEAARRSKENHEDLRDISTRLTTIEVKIGLRGTP